ncbi:MAG TPA: 2-isopropylmalate synthase [Longimicrobiales bacterium]|nr:2-isopropylmalate synthase [Longimicrobiales bacterium]
MTTMARITVFDTTLRDGEQSPGCSMTAAEKLRLAHELAELGVDVLEAGFPASSPEDLESVRQIGEEVDGPVIAGLARATRSDIERAAEALEPARKARIHVFIATSDIHLSRKLGITREQCLEQAGEAVELALTYADDVEFSAEDAMRSDLDFLTEVVRVAVAAGAKTVNIPDTVGYALPHEIDRTFRALLERVPGLSSCVLSTHCHDDLGLAVANSLAAIGAGARQVECTINGIGERAGNASLEEIVMALYVRRELLGYETGIRTDRIYRTSRLLSYLTGIEPQPNKAIVGRNAFAHEAGIHQHGVLNDRRTYEIMTPELVGAPGTELVMGKHSGRHGLEARYEALGYKLTREQLQRVTRDFKALADRKKVVLDEDLISILHHGVMEDVPEVFRLSQLEVRCGGESSSASAEVLSDGEPRRGEGSGDGPIAAVFAALDAILEQKVVLERFSIRAATPGRDALGEVTIEARVDGHTFTGRAAHTDVVRASAQAYLHAVNKAVAARALEASHTAAVTEA